MAPGSARERVEAGSGREEGRERGEAAATLASAPITAATAASAPNPTPPLPPTTFLTEDSPAFRGLQQQLDDQTSALSDIAASLQQLLTSSRNPEPQLPPPVAETLASATLPGSALGAPLPGESDMDRIFSWLSREVVQQVIDNTLPPQDLGRLRNPDSLPVDDEHEHAVLVNGVLIKSVPSTDSTSSTRHFTKLIPDEPSSFTSSRPTGCTCGCRLPPMSLPPADDALAMPPQPCGPSKTRPRGTSTSALPPPSALSPSPPHQAAPIAKPTPSRMGHPPSARRASRCASGTMAVAAPRVMRAGGNTNVVVAPATTASRTAHDSAQAAMPRCPTGLDGLVSPTPLSHTAPDLKPAKRPPPLQGSARHIDGPAGPPDLSTPLLQGLAQLFGDSAGTPVFGTPPLQGSARPVALPVGLGKTRTPPLQGLARLFNSVLSALDVPSADRCLSLLLNAWSHNPGLRPNTSFADAVFDPALQPARHSSMQECAFAWSTLLNLYPDPIYHRQLLGMIEHGCLLGYDGPLRNADRRSDNLPISSVGHSHLQKEIAARLAEGRLSIIPASTNLVESPIGVVPKPRSTKLRTIHHLSHPRRPTAATLPSVNAGISPGFIRIRYEGLQDLLAFVSRNPGCLLWKGDLEDAFRHVVTAERDSHLLGFSYNGVRYRENALTFGGSSSPWLFNLVAEFLHWLVAACLPADWPVNHYLDDTFGAVPVSHTTHALLPIHILALAANALGLRLSPKKTFGTSTRLEVLGIEIDTVAQTVGITDDRRHHILAQCHSLLQHHSVDLLDMQWIAGLLQFVSQVFPCGKAFLRRLYDTTRRALPGKHHLTRLARLELLWWCNILERWSGTSVLSPSPLTAAHIWTDACPKGYGGYLGLDTSPTAVFAKIVPRRHRRKNIRFLEALAVLEALRCFLPLWSGPTLVVVHVDNENVEHGLRSGRSRDPLTQRLLREIFGLCLKHDLTIRPHLGVSARAANLLWHGLAASTRRRAGGTPSSFQSFCLQHFGFGTSCFPATSLHLLEWLAHLSSLGRPFHSAKHGLGALRSHHMDLGLDTSGFSCGRLERALRGYKRLHGVGHLGTKLPITLPLLRQVLLAVGKMADLFPRDRLVLQAAFALAFACFLRSGELVWDRGVDRATILTVSSIEWASAHVVLTLPASKTDPFRQGVRVVAPEVGGVECPVARLRPLSQGRPPSALLFGLGPSGLDPLPRSTFVTVLRRAIQACGLPASQYASHSFRRGAATWASQHGTSTADIQSLGRWSSDCSRRYIDRSAQERHALVASALFSVRNGPLVPSSPAWRDPGLA
ncbi:hypothetical protein NDA11_001420 [Ustilago hordei]|uniref:Reverse transcriptase domain-containing protein n=1 Tax=Ustilago hordei TaxID=120017 RepID=I2FWM2_USTHO|nr:hypothetical protein NDA15_001439 [Ustilago hordei]KAJ1590062.1 hypothetical protein NDA12_003732 [Ustilago hordei]KAJ1594186.1 hypothetical protein NDA11_001420 [Ustilago hordei]KAJ1602191.1 hypothetical protein NDA14_002694 [Ustilago hordei]CCF51315.1 uncharacterized protein UHOR_01239 [Ustilago hordei]